MNQVTELVRNRIKVIVSRGLDSYGIFPIQREKEDFYDIAVELLLGISDRIDTGEIISVTEFRGKLIESLFNFGFNLDRSLSVFDFIWKSLYHEVEITGIAEPNTIRIYEKYEDLLKSALSDSRELLKVSVPEYLGDIPEYGVAERKINLKKTSSRLLISNRSEDVEPVVRSRLQSKFSGVFDQKVKQFSDIISGASRDINSITSDSRIPDFLDQVDQGMLVATFAGEGKKVYKDVQELFNFSVKMSGYQGALVGAVEYQARYYEYMMAMCYGKVLPQGVLTEDFGNFEQIYQVKSSKSKVPGLKFLESLYTTRSANQRIDSSTPVAEKYYEGVKNRYVPPPKKKYDTDFTSLALESVYLLCLKIGDSLGAFLDNPPKGIGDTFLHFKVLSKVFPKSTDESLRRTGITGTIESLLTSYRTLYSLLGYDPDLQDFNERFNELSVLLSSFSQNLRTAGFKPGGYIPSMELSYYEPDKEKIKSKLRSLGFNNVESDKIVNITSFSELLNEFAPVTDSQDVISFFRAYDLTKLIYEFGGQEGIDQYINFLYGKDEDSSILRLLSLLNRNRSLASKITNSEYSKLIGYIITLTYAVDPQQLSVLNSVLERNNLDLLESITFLIESGVPTLIKNKDSISLLSGMVAQMVSSDNSGYEYQKPEWNSLIEQSASNVGIEIADLYERAEGITPSELYIALKGPSATSPLGKILDGVRGGRLTSLLRYCNAFGLLYSLSPYLNSRQLVNKRADDYSAILDFLDNVDSLSDRLLLANLIVDNNAGGDKSKAVYESQIVQVQNKEFKAIIDLLQTIGTDETIDPDLYEIVESPGIGNSRVPSGVRISNSLTPEEAVLISTSGSRAGIFTQNPGPIEEGSYIRVSISNMLANGIVLESYGSTEDPGASVPDSPLKDYNTFYSPGTNMSSKESFPSSFSALESCLKFGNTNCDSFGYESGVLCSTGYNKSLFPEEGYGQNPSFTSGSILIDRPLGSKMKQNISYNTAEKVHPQYYFSAKGLSESSRSPILKDSEMMCASLRDPFEYSACMSLLKCTRFKPPYDGSYHFEFCPSNLHGGRLRRSSNGN